MFRSRSNYSLGRSRFISCNFTGRAPVYEERFDKDGILSLVHTGFHNIVDYVQASLEDTKVYNILERFALGDTSVLQKTKGFYADVSQMPTSLVEVHKFMTSFREKFDKMPEAVKAKFDNDVQKFLDSLSNGSFLNMIKDIDSPPVPGEESDPVPDKEV